MQVLNSQLVSEWRALTPDEALRVMQAQLDSTSITGYSYDEWTRTRDTLVVRTRDGQIAGVCLLHHLWRRWSEIAVLWVMPDFRERGIGSLLFDRALARIKELNRKAVIYFSSGRMRSMVEARGFQVFDSERCLRQKGLSFRLYSLLYPVQYLAPRYRREEIRRKQRENAATFEFAIGFRLEEGL